MYTRHTAHLHQVIVSARSVHAVECLLHTISTNIYILRKFNHLAGLALRSVAQITDFLIFFKIFILVLIIVLLLIIVIIDNLFH